MGHDICTNEVGAVPLPRPFLRPITNDLRSLSGCNLKVTTGAVRAAAGVRRRESDVKQDVIRVMFTCVSHT